MEVNVSVPSSFYSPVVGRLVPYVPGEQPKLDNLVKLNTNENPYLPHRAPLRRFGWRRNGACSSIPTRMRRYCVKPLPRIMAWRRNMCFWAMARMRCWPTLSFLFSSTAAPC